MTKKEPRCANSESPEVVLLILFGDQVPIHCEVS